MSGAEAGDITQRSGASLRNRVDHISPGNYSDSDLSTSQSRCDVLNGFDDSSCTNGSLGVASRIVSDASGHNSRWQQARTQTESRSSPAPTSSTGLQPVQQVFPTSLANCVTNVENHSDSYSSSSGYRLHTDSSSGSYIDGSSTQGYPYQAVPVQRTGHDEVPFELDDTLDMNSGGPYERLYPLLRRSPYNKGFVNPATMARPDTIEGVRVGVRLLCFDDHIYRMPLLEILEDVRTASKILQRSHLIKFLQIQKLPFLAVEKQLGDISLCLLVEDAALQSNACLILEEIILQLQQSQDKSVTKELLTVAEKTHEALLKMNDNDNLMFNVATLHLMAVSAMFTRCERPDLEACASFNLATKGNKKAVSGGRKQAVFKSLHEFYHRFKDDVKELSPCPYWTEQQVHSSAEQDLVSDKNSMSSYFKLFIHTFSILNEIGTHGWSHLSLTLLNALTNVHEAVEQKAGKQKISQDSRAMIEFFIVRGLVVLLNTVFTEDREPFGNCQYDHQERISRMISDFIRSCGDGAPQKERLLREARGLAFHKASRVRLAFSELQHTARMPLNELASGHIEHSLRGIGFRLDEARQAETEGRCPGAKTCGWQASPCKLGDVKADCAMYLSAVSCMNKDDFKVGTCLTHDPGRHSKEAAARSEMHKQNLTMLQRLSPRSDHVLQLLAYQYKPFPFYITEAVEEEDRLLSYLCLHRKEGRWLDTKTIVKILYQIIDIADLLERESIVTRDLTCYNLVVRKEGRDQTRKSRSQVLQSSDNFVIQLADLSLTHSYRNHGDVCIVRDHGPIPVRWTAPEALFEGRYSLQSMIWQIGCIMYEMTTCGCEPYTSYRDLNTEDILTKMNTEPGTIKLFRWPCIPEAIMDMIERCTSWNPEERPSLEQLRHSLGRIEEVDSTVDEMPLEEALIVETQYPSPSSSQIKRGHVPEKGIPAAVQELIAAKKDSTIYKKVRILSWHEQDFTAIEDGELVTPEWIKIDTKHDCTLVKEKLSHKFVKDYLPLIESSKLPVKRWRDGEQGLVRFSQHDGLPVHEREYSASRVLRNAVVMEELSAADHYELPTEDFLQPCLHVLVSFAKCMSQLHSQGWIIRDIQASSILVDCETGEAIPARIGRMCLLRGTEQRYVDEPFPDCWRRLPPEVLVAKTYSRASDVFTFVTMVWEIFFARDRTSLDPNTRKEDLEPCAKILRNEVMSFVRENTKLPKPKCCPEWLYQLILQGRHPDPSQRPTADDILSTLTEHLSLTDPPTPFITQASRCPVPEGNTEEKTPEESQIERRKQRGFTLVGISKLFAIPTRRDVKTENFSQQPSPKKKPLKVAMSVRGEIRDPQQLQYCNGSTQQEDRRKTKSSIFSSRTGEEERQTENRTSLAEDTFLPVKASSRKKKLRSEETLLKMPSAVKNMTLKKKEEHETAYMNIENSQSKEIEDADETRVKAVDFDQEENLYHEVDPEEEPPCLTPAVNDAEVDKNGQKQAGKYLTRHAFNCRNQVCEHNGGYLTPQASLAVSDDRLSLQTTGQNKTTEHAEAHGADGGDYQNLRCIFLPEPSDCVEQEQLSNDDENELPLAKAKRPPKSFWKRSKRTLRQHNRMVSSAITASSSTSKNHRSTNLFQPVIGTRNMDSDKRAGWKTERQMALRSSSPLPSDTRPRASDGCGLEGRLCIGNMRPGNQSEPKKKRRETAVFNYPTTPEEVT